MAGNIPTKRRRQDGSGAESAPALAADTTVVAEFRNEEGELAGPQVSLPVNASTQQMIDVVNKLLQNSDSVPYIFFLKGEEITADVLLEHLVEEQKKQWLANMKKEGRRVTQKMLEGVAFTPNVEEVLQVTYRPQAVFKVRSLTRCSSTLSGHSEPVLVCAFSPESKRLATGSGDATVRLWDLDTDTPIDTLTAHKQWVQALAWSPDGHYLASGSKDAMLCVWEGTKLIAGFNGHKKFITALSWEPLHSNLNCDKFVSASKDGTLRVWKVTKAKANQLVGTLSGHTASVTCVKWGGLSRIYSCSQDRTIIIWDAAVGVQVRKLEGHAHWINFLALNTDLVLRSGAYDHTQQDFGGDVAAMQRYAQERFDAVVEGTDGGERLISCSDDQTLFLWAPRTRDKPIARLMGHQGAVCHVSFSPDGRTIASASFDKSIKLWSAVDGKFIASLRAHVSAVYFVAWSIDSRQLLSASKDSTLKLWSMKTKKLLNDLPGHMDEVFACDWSPDGLRACSGSKDKTIRIWRH